MLPRGHKRNDKGLGEKLKRAAGKPMSKDEVLEQRISFVYGQLQAGHGLTREQVEKRIRERQGT